MKKNYTTASIANYGSCKNLIQGGSVFGFKNITLGNVGASSTAYYYWIPQPCAGPAPDGTTNCYAVCTKVTKKYKTYSACTKKQVGKKKKI